THRLWYAGELGGTYATFDCGFVDLHVTDERFVGDVLVPPLLATAGDYLRRVSLEGPTSLLAPALALLCERPRPWLTQLAIARPHELSTLVVPALAERLVRALPHLEVLDLLGRHLFEQLAHPNLRELGISGAESIDVVDGPPLPALHTIDFTFDGDQPTPRGLFSPARLPALRRLACSRAEPGGERLFEALGTLAVADQLTHLVLPSLRSHRDVALVQAAITRMPRLRELAFARSYACFGPLANELQHEWARVRTPDAWPWPPREQLAHRVLEIDGFPTNVTELVEVLEAQYDALPEELRAIWYRFWMVLDARGLEHAFHTADLTRALDALELGQHLQRLRATLATGKRGVFGTMLWL
ncbi:MAG TPA: hypothetical protein VK427_20765, partial [Kofleriaceae bacterium]|nr:hypothetical protein [Kofleriaceae bacterium]